MKKWLPYSGLFSWGANFRYFRGQPMSHEIFHPRILRSAVQSRASSRIRDKIATKFRTTKIICNNLASFSRKFAPTKLTRYTV